MGDERLRAVERTWRRTGATGAALLRERLRTGQLTRERLHLAAFVGDAAARAVYEPPSEAAIEAAVAPARFDGVEAEVQAMWTALIADWKRHADAFGTYRLLLAARKLEGLGRLFPFTSMTAVGFSRCTEGPSWPYVTIEPPERSGRFTVRVALRQDQAGDLPPVVAVTTRGRALKLAADVFEPHPRVLRGNPNALFLDRLRAGAVDDDPSLVWLFEGLITLDVRAAARALLALLDRLPVARRGPSSRGVRALHEALRLWCLEPADDRAAAIDMAVAAILDRASGRDRSFWARIAEIRALVRGGAPSPWLVAGWPIPDAEVRAALRDAITPWALGLADPVVVEPPPSGTAQDSSGSPWRRRKDSLSQ